MSDRSTKLVLNNKELTEEFFSDTRLLGVMAPIKDYQFCWHLNNNIGLDFRINNDIEIKLLKRNGGIFLAYMSIKNQPGFYRILCTITSLTENIYCPNLSTSIFVADER